MSRIRTVKPTIWTDGDFVDCSPNARLLFIAGLNFASDYGVLADKPAEIKMQCFPNDQLNIAELIDELVLHRLWLRMVAPDNARVLVIRTFSDHQKVDKPTGGRWGDPKEWPGFAEQSTTPPVAVGDPSDTEGKGKGCFAPIPKAPKPPKAAPAADASVSRTRRDIWSVLSAKFGEPSTQSERTNRGRQCRELLEAGATGPEVTARIKEHAARNLRWDLTANALVTHWTELTPKLILPRTMNGANVSRFVQG